MIATHEPSVVAVSQRTGQVLAVGTDARRMLGRASADIVLMPPPHVAGRHPRPRPSVTKRYSSSPGLFVSLCALMLLLSMLSGQPWASGAVGVAKSVLAPIAGAMTSLEARVDRITSMFGDVASLRAENQRLRAADQQLRSQLLELRADAKENQSLRQALDFEHASGYNLVAAQVVSRGPDGFSRTMEVDRGTADGVRVGMTVVTGAGLLGRIKEAGPHSAVVQTLLDLPGKVDVVLVNSNVHATVRAQAGGLRLQVVPPAGATLSSGDWALTSGESGGYPRGLVVGEIAHVAAGQTPSSEVADLAWVNDPSETSFVLVITSFTPS
jgi:rod shape-determining protein MreC